MRSTSYFRNSALPQGPEWLLCLVNMDAAAAVPDRASKGSAMS